MNEDAYSWRDSGALQTTIATMAKSPVADRGLGIARWRTRYATPYPDTTTSQGRGRVTKKNRSI